jgi:hypothetical protein
MIVRRILAGFVVTLLLGVSSMAAACDLSCAFAVADSDCHSREAASQSLTDSRTAMDGMDMAGMAMPAMNKGEDLPTISDISQARAAHPAHPLISDMGPCERQSCDKGTFVSVKANRAGASRLRLAPAIASNSLADTAPPLFHDARDDVASALPSHRNSLQLNLRI